MIKNYFYILAAFIALPFVSCTTEVFVDDIALYEDVFIEVVAITDASREGQRASYHVTYLETNNEGFLVETTNAGFTSYVDEQPITFNDKINSYDLPPYSMTNIKPIKAYGQAGVILRPEQNIIGFNVIISDVDDFASEILYVEIDDLAPEITFIYDFDTDTFTVE